MRRPMPSTSPPRRQQQQQQKSVAFSIPSSFLSSSSSFSIRRYRGDDVPCQFIFGRGGGPRGAGRRGGWDENDAADADEDGLNEKIGDYTVKQRLREEIESPFRQVRFWFFASSAGSAVVALYFSALAALKASPLFNAHGVGVGTDVGTDVVGVLPPDGVPSDAFREALQTCGINGAGVIVCAALAYREYLVGEKNLERIARGGALARLRVERPIDDIDVDVDIDDASSSRLGQRRKIVTLKEYRRNARVMIAAGGTDFIQDLARSLTADQRRDVNTLPRSLAEVDVVIVPVLLTKDERIAEVGDTRSIWRDTTPGEGDRNMDLSRADPILAFPVDRESWTDYLRSELEQATKQGFDVLSKGITLTVKKNGKILRRVTGLPRWADFIGTMEVMDGSRFGMPGDSELYGGP